MSRNIQQVYTTNPITSNSALDLMYFGQSPYGLTNDAAMTYTNFAAQFGAPYTPAALTRTSDTNVTLTLGGTPSTALLQATSITAGWSGTLSLARGGLAAALTASNGGIFYSTATAGAILSGTATASLPLLSGSSAAPSWGSFALSLGGALTTAGALTTVGAFGVTFTFTNTTGVTFPTSGTLATTSQIPTGAALTKTDDTNVTLTLGGSPTTALVNAASITVGWSGTLALARGGLEAALTASNGGIFYSTASAGAILAGTATAGKVLQSGATAAPTWSTPTYPSASGTAGFILRSDGTNNVYSQSTYPDLVAVSNILYATASNTVGSIAATASSVLISNSSSVPSWTGAMTNGQVVIGSTGATPVAASLSAGTGISITPGAGTITIANTAGTGFTWNDLSGTTQTAVINNGYVISNAGQTTVTIPATAAVGTLFAVQGKGAAGWIIQMNTGQICHLGNLATSSAGTLTSTNLWDSITLVCVTANTTFAVTSVVGVITVA